MKRISQKELRNVRRYLLEGYSFEQALELVVPGASERDISDDQWHVIETFLDEIKSKDA